MYTYFLSIDTEEVTVTQLVENLVPVQSNDLDNDNGIADLQRIDDDKFLQPGRSMIDEPTNNSDLQDTRFHVFENGTIRQANEIKHLKLQLEQERSKSQKYEVKYEKTKQLA